MILTHLTEFQFFTGAGEGAPAVLEGAGKGYLNGMSLFLYDSLGGVPLPPMDDIPHPFKRRVALRGNNASRPRRYAQETLALKRPNPCRDEKTPLR